MFRCAYNFNFFENEIWMAFRFADAQISSILFSKKNIFLQYISIKIRIQSFVNRNKILWCLAYILNYLERLNWTITWQYVQQTLQWINTVRCIYGYDFAIARHFFLFMLLTQSNFFHTFSWINNVSFWYCLKLAHIIAFRAPLRRTSNSRMSQNWYFLKNHLQNKNRWWKKSNKKKTNYSELIFPYFAGFGIRNLRKKEAEKIFISIFQFSKSLKENLEKWLQDASLHRQLTGLPSPSVFHQRKRRTLSRLRAKATNIWEGWLNWLSNRFSSGK